LGFVPSDADLNYPEILDTTQVAEASDPSSMSVAPATQATYPTLSRTLLFLARLAPSVERTVFESLAQEAVDTCTSSLLSAGASITRAKGELDGQLFLISHLLTLRDQITPFDINFTTAEQTLDFTNMKEALGRVARASRMALFSFSSNNALLDLLQQGAPRVLVQSHDSKKDLEMELRRTCEEFIQHATREAVQPLLTFLSTVICRDLPVPVTAAGGRVGEHSHNQAGLRRGVAPA